MDGGANSLRLCRNPKCANAAAKQISAFGTRFRRGRADRLASPACHRRFAPTLVAHSHHDHHGLGLDRRGSFEIGRVLWPSAAKIVNCPFFKCSRENPYKCLLNQPRYPGFWARWLMTSWNGQSTVSLLRLCMRLQTGAFASWGLRIRETCSSRWTMLSA